MASRLATSTVGVSVRWPSSRILDGGFNLGAGPRGQHHVGAGRGRAVMPKSYGNRSFRRLTSRALTSVMATRWIACDTLWQSRRHG